MNLQDHPEVKDALKAAVEALYFDDSADFAPALRAVIRAIDITALELLDTDEHAAYERYCERRKA